MQERYFPPLSPVATGAPGRCPRCGEGKLFRGFVELRPACESCQLDYGFADSGDGPAVFVILLAGFMALGMVLWIEFTYEPSIWVHALVSMPLTLAICLGLLRPLKGLFIAQQYRHKAEQGRLEP
jgi:uncharacterized protein (DUF983 family)